MRHGDGINKSHIWHIRQIFKTGLIDLWMVIKGLYIVAKALPHRSLVRGGSLKDKDAVYPNWKLPHWAYYWDNMDHGVGGDKYWRTEHHPDDWYKQFTMWKWAAIRNPAFNWGIEQGINGVVKHIEVHGKQGRIDNYLNTQGKAWRELWMEDGKYMRQYSMCYAYPHFFGKKHYGFRIQIGPFIQAAKVGKYNCLGQSVLVQPWKHFKESV